LQGINVDPTSLLEEASAVLSILSLEVVDLFLKLANSYVIEHVVTKVSLNLLDKYRLAKLTAHAIKKLKCLDEETLVILKPWWQLNEGTVVRDIF